MDRTGSVVANHSTSTVSYGALYCGTDSSSTTQSAALQAAARPAEVLPPSSSLVRDPLHHDGSFSDRALAGIAAVGAYAEQYGFGPAVKSAADSVGNLDTVREVAKSAGKGYAEGFKSAVDNADRFGFPKITEKLDETNLTFGTIGKIVDKTAKGLNAVTGMLDVSVAVKRDRERGDTSYTGAMKEVIFGTAQVAAGAAAGNLVGGAVAGLAFATLSGPALPIVVGVGAGIAVSYGVGKAFDALRSWWG